MNVDKKQFKDEKGRYIVQGLFLEIGYKTDLAVFTLDGEDKLYKGRVYPSLKKLFLLEGDVEEYTFATKHLFDWNHWQRVVNNKLLKPHVESWREELELSLRSEGMATMVDLAIEGKSYQAAKFLIDKGWVKSKKGRPSKEDIDRKLSEEAKIAKEYEDDFTLLEMKNG